MPKAVQTMISSKLAQKLQEQVGHELGAHQQYLAIGTYFAQQNLDKWAALFYQQAAEEKEHAMKIVRFLTDVGEVVHFPAIPAASTGFKSAADAVAQALKWERTVTEQFQTMAKIALAEGDYVGFQFLQWFLEEQVEEVSSMEKYLALVESGINLFQAEALLEVEA
ncbi:ferritin [Meiothermus ruber]|uniref:Ferritin n=1 Tax=Meiothermus ruber (strain ATCC 35948 / DSM 1279 / VKM B-1258 / 21) TaxID=504728 RepID=D3PQ56_MEIRD|nr:ferritin [Meiothermus ruber]ADD27682.1 Ferritin Dps family protein [Meiothermus ruber DSM 1279]AGK04147.1 ferritin Dps family protein [Meiothermus ruber DSM 1279]